MIRSFILRESQDADFYQEIDIVGDDDEVSDAEVYEVRLLKSFEDDEAAVIYCEEQYTLFNGEPPMIESGDYAKFHPVGRIAEVDIDDDLQCGIVVNEASDADEYLVIVRHDYFAAYSLASFSMCRKPDSS